MLTVRINGLHGDQVVAEVAYVIRSDPRDHSHCDGLESKGVVEFYNSKHEQVLQPVHYGNVYVMNGSGKTVAVYELGWAEPKAA
jgi:hypothetical protein